MNLILSNLNPNQIKAVTSRSKRIACMAGPGTGKTRTLTARVAHMILDRKISPHDIWVITFTNKAAAEVKERLEDSLGEHRVRKMTVGTFHSTIYRLLCYYHRTFEYRYIPTIYDENDSIDVINYITENSLLGIKPKEGWKIKVKKYQDLIEPEAQEERIFLKNYEEFIYYKSLAIDFDQILYRFYSQLFDDEDFRITIYNKFKFVFVDEYQDTNAIQAAILNTLDPEHLFAVGDLDQAIYAWRGAKLEELETFADRDDAELIYLDLSYRCPPEICRAAHNLILKNNRGFKHEVKSNLKSSQFIKNVIEAYKYPNELVQFQEIAELCKMEDKDIGILSRTNDEALKISEALTANHVDHILLTNRLDLWRHETVRDILAYVKCIINPRDQLNFFRVVRFPQRKDLTAVEFSRLRARALMRGERFQDQFKKAFPDDVFFRLQEELVGWDSTPRAEMDALTLIKDIVGRLELPKILNEKQLKTRMEILNRLYRYIEYWMASDNGGTIKEFLDHLIFKDMQERLILEEAQIKVMTVHGSKGLEFDVVMVPSLIDGYFPQKRGEMEEERRLFYVAITRTKEKLYLLNYHESTYLMAMGIQGTAKASRFISEIK